MSKSSKIRVLSVCTSDVSGGAARAAYRIHQGVQSLGVDSRMLVKYKGSNDPTVHALEEFIPHNALYDALDWCAAKVKNKIQHYQWNRYPNQDSSFKSDMRSTRIFGALHAFDYDVLHLHWINQRFLPLDELAKIHKPIVWTLHDSWPFCGTCHYFLDCENYQRQCGNCPQLASNNSNDLSHQIWQRKYDIYKTLDLHIVSPSHWLAECARRSSLFLDRDIHVIPNGLDTNVFRPLSDEEIQSIADNEKNEVVKQILSKSIQNRQNEKPMLLYGAVNATKDKIKGFSNLLLALQKLDEQRLAVHLVVFGADTQNLPINFKYIDVSFVGHISNSALLVGLYNAADVMVVPSYTEVFGQTASEAMACGTPVVAFRCTGIQDVVGAESGFLATPYSTDDLAYGIQWCLLNNRDNVLGKNARDKVLNNYTSKIISEKYKELYLSLI